MLTAASPWQPGWEVGSADWRLQVDTLVWAGTRQLVTARLQQESIT